MSQDIEKLKEKKDVAGLIKALSHKDAEVRQEAAEALGEIKDKRAIEPLIATLADEEEYVRGEAASALGVIRDKRAVEPLIAALADEEAYVRGASAFSLGEINDKKAVEPLIDSLKDEEGGVRSKAAEALGQLGDERAVEPLIKALDDEDKIVQWRAYEALERMDTPKAKKVLKGRNLLRVFVVPHLRSARMAASFIDTFMKKAKSKVLVLSAMAFEREGKRRLELADAKDKKVGLKTLSGRCILFVPRGAPVDLIKKSPELSQMVIEMNQDHSENADLGMMDLMLLAVKCS
jgi:HEAT repeat protein